MQIPPTHPPPLVPRSDHMFILFTHRKRTSELSSRHQYIVILSILKFGFSMYALFLSADFCI